MRSPREIAFRLRQEAVNLALLVKPPGAAPLVKTPLDRLPDPARVAASLRGSAYARDVEALAEKTLAHRFPLLGIEIETGPEIDWRRDYVSGRSTGLEYFRRIPYLDASRAGDHKTIWELNRHQHLVLLAQAWRLTGREEFAAEIGRQLESWLDANPYGRGINWASALEVAFRALSWIWVWHLAAERLDAALRERFLRSLYAHARHLENNLSIYFSPNTHLLGEAVALHAIGALFPYRESKRWKTQGGAMVRAQMEAQTRADGSHFEQSSYYHVYALDMFLFAAALEDMPAAYLERLARMADYLDALLGPERRLPFLGDDDGGRFFHPYGERDRFGRASLAACAGLLDDARWRFDEGDSAEIACWWLGARPARPPSQRAPESQWFPGAGVAVMTAGETHAVVDAGPFGAGSGGHSHADTLHIVARRGAEELLVDAGTHTYVADPKLRDWFRGAAAHNTIRIDGLDQAEPAGPFAWSGRPKVEALGWETSPDRDCLDGVCTYRGFRHRRIVQFLKPDRLFILDVVDGSAGRHRVEQFWHAGTSVATLSPNAFRIGECATLLLTTPATAANGGEHGWRSIALGEKRATTVVRAEIQGSLPMVLGAVLDLSGDTTALDLALAGSEVVLRADGRQSIEVRFALSL